MSSRAPWTVLVIDDDELIGWALARELSSRGFHMRLVSTGADGLAELRARRYDIIFLDVALPDTNGFDLMAEIGAISPESRVIVLSADASEGARRRALTGGAMQFIEKPFDIVAIHSVLKSATGDYQPKRKHPRYLCHLPVRISIVGPLPEYPSLDVRNLGGQMADIGAGGLRIHTEYPLRIGQSIRARLDAMDDPFSTFLPPDGMAEVVWVEPDDRFVTAGLKFRA